MHAKVEIYSHHFVVSEMSPQMSTSIYQFTKHLVQWGLTKERGQFKRAPQKYFYIYEAKFKRYRFHIGFIGNFKNFVTNFMKFTDAEIQWISVPLFEPIKTEFKAREEFSPRDYQLPAIEYMTQIDMGNPLKIETSSESNRKFLTMQTGDGKGAVSMFSMVKQGDTVVVVVKPMYIEKWHKELLQILELTPEDIVVIEGSKQLKQLLKNVEDGDRYKVYIFSNATLRNWLTEYEEVGDDMLDMGYGCRPQDLCEHLGAGVRLIDELHQDFHFNFRLDLFTHIRASYSLTATFISDDPFVSRIYAFTHPLLQRFKNDEYKRYCACTSARYRLRKPEKIRYTSYGMNAYSHVEFEKSIMRHVPTVNRYMDMIKYVIDNTYIRGYKPGYKLMVFCSTKEFCTMLRDYLKMKYPLLDVRRYVEEDPYENVLDPDIRVSTLLSAGTAIDIPGLYVSFQTTALSSTSGNLQSLGRLRNMKDGETPMYIFLSCLDIDKQMEYDAKKCEILKDKAISFGVMPIPEPV